jgi:3-oxoacyl-[acyl-carrier protein] reductase
MARAAVAVMRAAAWGRIINISVSNETMRRRGFSPYGPSKAALESETVIWAQDLARYGCDREFADVRRSDAHRHGSDQLPR